MTKTDLIRDTALPRRRAEEAEWSTVIDAERAGWSLEFGELWRYRDLLYLLARRDVVTIYKQTILGPIWYVLQPLLTSLMFVVIFTRVAQIPTDGVPPVLFYMAGTILWTFFSESLKTTSDTYVKNAELFQKVYFPRAIVPAASVLAGAFKFGIQLLLFAAFCGYYAVAGGYTPELSPAVLAIVPLAACTALLGLGVGLVLSSLTYKYRDLTYFVQFAVQLAMYGTPVVYPLSAAPERLRPYLELNPVTALVEGFRLVTLGTGTVTAASLAYSVGATVVLLLLGLLAFNRAARTFADSV